MFTVCGCDLDDDEAVTLLELLDNDVTLVSDEASAAIRYAISTGAPANKLDPAIKAAVKHALADERGLLPPGLQQLRVAVSNGC